MLVQVGLEKVCLAKLCGDDLEVKKSKNYFGSRSKKDATGESPLKTAAQFV